MTRAIVKHNDPFVGKKFLFPHASISSLVLSSSDTYAATCSATISMSTKSSSFSEFDSSSSARVSRIPDMNIKKI